MAELLQSLRFIETTLASDEGSTDAEILAHLSTECPEVAPALIAELITNERQQFFLEPLHIIDWIRYEQPNPYPNAK